MTNSTATRTITSTIAATLVATILSASSAVAGGEGGGDFQQFGGHRAGKTFVTVHNKDGSTKTVRKGCCGTRFKEKRNKRGNLISKRNYRPDRSSWASSRDPSTGKTYVSGRSERGQRFSFTISPFGSISFGINR